MVYVDVPGSTSSGRFAEAECHRQSVSVSMATVQVSMGADVEHGMTAAVVACHDIAGVWERA